MLGDDGRLVAGDTTGNPSIVVNETAMRTLGFRSPSEAIGKTVTWNRRRFSFNPNPGTTGPSEIIGVAPDFALDTRRKVLPQILYVDPASFTTLSVRLLGSKIPEALEAIDAAWRETGNTNIRRRFLSQRLQDLYSDVVLQGTSAGEFEAQIAALKPFLEQNWRASVSLRTGMPVYERPVALVLYREDHRFLLDQIIPRAGRTEANFDLIIASQPYRAKSSVNFRARRIIAPLARALGPGGRLIGTNG